MRKNIAALTGVVLLIGIPAISVAQLPSFGGLGSKPSGGGDLSGQQAGLVKSYVAGGKDVPLLAVKVA